MTNKTVIFKAGAAGFVLGSVFLAALTGCVGYVPNEKDEKHDEHEGK